MEGAEQPSPLCWVPCPVWQGQEQAGEILTLERHEAESATLLLETGKLAASGSMQG